MNIEQFVELVIFAIPTLFTILFLTMLISEEFDLGINDRIVDAIERIQKVKGVRK